MKKNLLYLLIFISFTIEGHSKHPYLDIPYNKLMDFEDDGDGPPVEDPPPPAPIDEWLPYLLLSGLALASYSAKHTEKNNQKNKSKST